MLEVIIRYVHFIGIFGLVSTLVAEHLLVKPNLTLSEARHLAVLDALYGLSAVTVLAAGLSLWFWVGKPAAFYTGNPIFHVKLGAFIVAASLSVYPTIFFLKSRNSVQAIIPVPRKIIIFIRAQLGIVILIPLLAVLVARGYGLA